MKVTLPGKNQYVLWQFSELELYSLLRYNLCNLSATIYGMYMSNPNFLVLKQILKIRPVLKTSNRPFLFDIPHDHVLKKEQVYPLL